MATPFLVRDDTVALYGFLEVDTPPVDDVGNLDDLLGDPTSTPELEIAPIVISELTGRAREFGVDRGLIGSEKIADATRLIRDVTIRCFIDYAIGNAIDGDKGTIVARGKFDGSTAERIMFGLELERVSAVALRVRARWQVGVGLEAVVEGVTFVKPTGIFHLAVVRRWIDTTTVDLTYVLNDRAIGSETVISPTEIGGGIEGIGGSFLVGAVGDGTVGTYERFLPDDTIVPMLSVESDAVSVEELRQDVRRIVIHQVTGGTILRSFEPPGDTWTRRPDSRVQRWIASEGDGLGFALGEAERLRDDFLPDRAYGRALERWEFVNGLAPLPRDSIADRRTRLLSFLRRVLGFQIDDIKFSLELVFGLDSADIDIVEYDALREDDFSLDDILEPPFGGGPSKIWRTFQGAGTIAIPAASLDIDIAAGAESRWESADAPHRAASLSSAINGDVDGATLITEVTVTAIASPDTLAGHVFYTPARDAIFFGVIDNGVTRELVTFTVLGGIVSAFTVVTTPFAAGTFHLLSRYLGAGLYDFQSSTTGPLGPFSAATSFAGPTSPRWLGPVGVHRLDPGAGGALDVSFDDAQIHEPNGLRALGWQAFRDPGLPGTFDLKAAQLQLLKQKPAHTRACAVTTLDGFKLGPTGAGQLGCDPLFPSDQIIS